MDIYLMKNISLPDPVAAVDDTPHLLEPAG